ncbi:MAG TPA: heavy metal-binding domain-containing protein, partial [Desulfuromonadales bacterium]|nr:heavy metal-binding domain-containing protein [Desulfuromonadales bacterium]
MKDPVCGMDVTAEKAAGTAQWQGETYYFCSTHCREKFVADPAGTLQQREEKDRGVRLEAASGAEREYTCPMHPEVVQQGPGSCPICGMDLEPKEFSAEEAENPELVAMTRRFWVSLALSVPVLFLAMSADLLPGQPLQRLLGTRTIVWIELVLSTPVVLWGGSIFFTRAWASLVHRSLNMFTLIGLGTGVAYLYSL